MKTNVCVSVCLAVAGVCVCVCFEAGRCLAAHYSWLSEEQRGEMLSDGPLNCTFVLWKLESTLYDEVSGSVCEWHTKNTISG